MEEKEKKNIYENDWKEYKNGKNKKKKRKMFYEVNIERLFYYNH